MESTDALDALDALSQPTRLAAFRLLVRNGPGGLPAGELARLLGVPQNTLSSHLSVLRHAGLVAAERRSRSILYRAEIDAVRRLAGFLVDDCCGGRPELCVPAARPAAQPAVPAPTLRERA